MRGCFNDITPSVKPQYPGWTARAPPDLCDRLFEGAFLGIAEENGQYSYAVHLYAVQRCWFLSEDALKATGRFDRGETFYN
ncbi:MAG: immunity protein 31, partial [Anaerolineae bacterium]|nr:immunity protein 31 [Anaerolineae bacterium]